MGNAIFLDFFLIWILFEFFFRVAQVVMVVAFSPTPLLGSLIVNNLKAGNVRGRRRPSQQKCIDWGDVVFVIQSQNGDVML